MQDNPYLPLVEKEAEQGVRASMLTAVDKQPDTEAKLQNLARRYGMPVEAVRLNQPEVQRRAAFESVDYETLAREMPGTASWLSTPENAAIGHDNVDNLGAIERTMRGLGSAAMSGLLGASAGVVGAVQAPVDLLAPIMDPLAGTILPENPLRRVAAGLSEYRQSIEANSTAWMPQGQSTVERGILSGVGSLSRNVAALPLALAPGGQSAALTAMVAPVAGQEYGQARDMGVSPVQAATYGASQAAIEYATEKIPVSRLIGDLASNAGFGKLLARQAVAEVPGEQVATALQDLNEWATLRPEATFADYLKERPGAAAETLIATLVGVGGQTTLMSGLDAAINRVERQGQKAQQAEQAAQSIAQLAELAKADKVLQRNPEAFEQFIKQAAEDGPVPTVYIDAQTLLQSGVADQLANVSASVAEQIEVAAATGGQIAIPVEEFAARIAPTDLAQGLIDHIRTETDGFTRAEAQQYMQSQAQELEAQVQRTLSEKQSDDAFRTSQEAVKAAIQQELDGLGRFTPEKNEADAALFASYYAVRAAQLGTTPEELYQQRRVKFAAESLGGQELNQVAIDTPEFANWFGDSKVVTPEGKPLVVYHGGGPEFDQIRKTGRFGEAIFVTDDKPSGYGKATYPLFLRGEVLENDMILDLLETKKGRKALSDAVGKRVSGEKRSSLIDALTDGSEYPSDEGVWETIGAIDEADAQVEMQKIRISLAKSMGYSAVRMPDEFGGSALAVVDPTSIKSATGNRGTFDPNDPNILHQGARGAFSPENLTVTLLKGADLSTALHEGAHFFFENDIALAAELVRENAAFGADTQTEGARQIVADVSALMNWHGITGTVQEQLATWYGMDFEARRTAHERTAESFEAYLFDGKAPSLELAPYFQKFRAWMVNVYKSIKQFLSQNPEAGKLDDTVRGVFDRMLATSEQIKLAEQGRSMLPLFATAEEAGKSVEEFAAYQGQGTQATADAIEDLQARCLRDMQWLRNATGRELKRLQKMAEGLRSEARTEARAEVLSRPIYQAWGFLTAKEDGGKLYLNPTDVTITPEMEAVLKARKMTADDGFHPDILAEKFGFGSGDQLMRELVLSDPPSEVVEALTDRLMLERHGELATPEALARAADAAVHNAARARMVATETNALAQAAGQRKVLLSAAREFARNVVARVKVKDLRPSQYANAASRAGQNAGKASRAGDVATAAAEKRNQLVQTLAAKEAHEAREEADALRRSWSALANRSDEKLKKSYDMDLINAVRAILSNVGIAEHKGKKAAEYLENLRDYDPTMHAVISQSVTAAEAIGKPMKDMTIEEVRGLADEIEAILHLARRSRQMEVDGKLLDREEIEGELQMRMSEIGVPGVVPGEGAAITPSEQRLAKFRTLIAAGRRVESWVGSMDGSAQMGPFRRYVFGTVKDAADRYRTDKSKYLKQFRTLFDTVAPTLKPQLISAPELGYTFGKDSGGSAINEILHAILHTGNASNKRKLLLGRGWAVERENGYLDTSRWDGFINRMAAEGKLQKEHFDFAQGVWDMLEGIKPLAQKTHRDVFGKYFDEITAEPVQTPFGVYAGGYVPAMADSRIVTDAKLRKLQEEENAGMSYAFPTTPTGFTKSRVEYNRPLMLDLRTLAQHIDKVLLFSHMTGPVRDVQKVLTSVGSTLDKVSPGALDGMLTPWLNRAARQQVTTPIIGDGGGMRFFSLMRNRAGMAAMFGNVVNTAQQITGFSIAAVKVKPRLLLSASADMAKGPRAFVRAVTEASPYMAGRLDNEVAAMSDQINDILLNPSMLEKADRWTSQHAYFLQSAMDSWMSPIVWKGAYDQALENGATHDDAVKLGDSAVRETQGSSLPEDVSRLETGNAFVRLFTQFAGYFNMQANLLGTEFVKVARDMGLRSGAGRGLYVLFLGYLAPAIVSELIVQLGRGGPEDEDDDGYLDDWLAALFMAPMRNATAMVPGVGQAISAVVNATNGKPYDDRLATSPAISMLEAAARAPYSAYRAVVEDGSAQKAVRDVATLISMTVGLPANLAARPLGYLAGVQDGRTEPTGPADVVRGLVTGSAGQR